MLAIFAVGHAVESNILVATPRRRARPSAPGRGDLRLLRPSGALFGFIGLLLAVPVAAVIGVLVRFAIERYLASPLYDPPLTGWRSFRSISRIARRSAATISWWRRRNEAAVAWLDRWPHWPAPALVLWGPAGSGKTHLAQVFARALGRRRDRTRRL